MLKTWERQRADAIIKDLRREYGAGWDRLGDSLREALVSEKVLVLLLGQHEDRFDPAIKLATGVLRETNKLLRPEVSA